MQALFAACTRPDREHHRAAAERFDAELEGQFFSETAGLEEPDARVHQRNAVAPLKMEFPERHGESELEPALDQIVRHLEEAREKHDPCRISIGETYRANQREDSCRAHMYRSTSSSGPALCSHVSCIFRSASYHH